MTPSNKIDLSALATAAAPSPAGVPWKGVFEWISREQLVRPGQIRSLSLKLSEIEEFEENPRLEFPEEDQALLEESVRDNGITEEIGVFHIVDGDRYIICDGHRRKRAIEAVHGPDYKVEVIVRKEYQRYGSDTKAELLKVGLSTSSLKKSLSTYEEIEAVNKYLRHLDEVFPGEPPHEITQKKVYSGLFSKEKAMVIGRMLKTIPQEQWKAFKEADVPMKRARELSELLPKVDAKTAEQLVDLTGKGLVESKEDMREIVETRTEVDAAIPAWTPNREEVVTKVTEEKVKENKEEKSRTDKLPKNGKEKVRQDFKKHCKQFSKALATINPAEYDDPEKAEILTEAFQLYCVIKEFLTDNGAAPTEPAAGQN